MHYTSGKEETAKALPEIIKYLKEQGYEFKIIKQNSISLEYGSESCTLYFCFFTLKIMNMVYNINWKIKYGKHNNDNVYYSHKIVIFLAPKSQELNCIIYK